MCAPSPSPPSEAGFSLLEALISFAILAMALSAVFSAGMYGLRMTSRATERTEALMEARSLIDRIGADLPLVSGSYDGTTPLGHAYHLVIAPIAEVSGEPLRAYAVEADIKGRKAKTPIVSLRTLRTAKAAP